MHHDAKAATCTEKGWNAYDTCSRCDYSTYEEIAALGHGLVHHNAKAATCTEKGWNAYDTCSRCDYTTYAEIAALGHEWNESVYEWSADRTSVTASHTCKHDTTHTETETVDVTCVIQSPAEDTEGNATYTSLAFTKEGFAVQTKNLVIPALKDMFVIRLPETLTLIETESFSGLACQAVIIPDGCETIGEYAFRNCAGLLYVRIPASIKNWPENAFEGCNENLVIDRAAN